MSMIDTIYAEMRQANLQTWPEIVKAANDLPEDQAYYYQQALVCSIPGPEQLQDPQRLDKVILGTQCITLLGVQSGAIKADSAATLLYPLLKMAQDTQMPVEILSPLLLKALEDLLVEMGIEEPEANAPAPKIIQ